MNVVVVRYHASFDEDSEDWKTKVKRITNQGIRQGRFRFPGLAEDLLRH